MQDSKMGESTAASHALGMNPLPPIDNHERRVLVPQPTSDPRDPLNWPLRKKLVLHFAICWSAWSGALAPPAGQLAYFPQAELYDKTPTELTYSIDAAVAGLLGGSLLVVPLARVLGRTSVIFWSLVGALACQIWAGRMTGSDDYEAFIVSRLFAGLFGSSPTILGSGIVMDIFFLHQRGRAFAVYELSLLLGVVCSPTVGGFIVESSSWPVAFWWTLAPLGIAILLVFFVGEETGFARNGSAVVYPTPSSLFWKNRVQTLLPGTQVAPQNTKVGLVNSTGICKEKKLTGPYLAQSYVAPFIIGTSPIVLIAGLYTFVSFGFAITLSILLTIFLQTPEEEGGYGFTPSRNAAFTFVSWFTVLAAQLLSLIMSDRLPLWAARKYNHGIWRPEYRLWNMWYPAIAVPLGLALAGLTLRFHLHYMVLALGTFFVNSGAQLAVPLLINYVTECFITRPVEVSAAMNVWRLAFGLAVGFFVEPWEEKVGQGWVFGMAALFVVAVSLGVAMLAWKGKRLRQLYPLRSFAATEEGERVVGGSGDAGP